jgi:hypothetical protein
MTDGRVQFNVRLSADVADQFREFVKSSEGKTDGTLGEHAENALLEYMDRDRDARVEEKVDRNRELLEELCDAVSEADGHTHTPDSDISEPSTSGSPTVERTRQIAKRLQSESDSVVSNDDVERAIVDIAGGHDQTVKKYKSELRRRGLCFEHPNRNSDLWYLDRGKWFSAVTRHAKSTPSPRKTTEKIVEDYPVTVQAIDGQLEVVTNE